jgi:periplasmic copper chaperone A
MITVTTRHYRHLAVAAGCAATLVLAGCGSTAESGSSSVASTTAVSSTASSSSAAPSTAAPSTPTSSAAADEVTIADTWVKATAGTEDPTMTAAFGVLTNHTNKDLTIVSATNDVTDRTELHEMAMVDGAMVMRPITGGIPIPANGTTTLEPGGLHVMILDATAPITPGDDVHVTLTLSDGSTMLFHATAKEFAGANEAYDGATSGGMDMSSGAPSTESSAADDHEHTSGEAPHSDG